MNLEIVTQADGRVFIQIDRNYTQDLDDFIRWLTEEVERRKRVFRDRGY